MICHLWFAPGVEVSGEYEIPSQPPSIIRLDVVIPRPPTEAPSREYRSRVMTAEFRLANWSETGEVAHYELVSAPPAGWRWVVVGGHLRAERIGRAAIAPGA